MAKQKKSNSRSLQSNLEWTLDPQNPYKDNGIYIYLCKMVQLFDWSNPILYKTTLDFDTHAMREDIRMFEIFL